MRTESSSQSPLTRRNFLKLTGAAFATVSIVPSHVLGADGQTAPSNRINVAAVGATGMAAGDIEAVSRGANIVAIADADWRRAPTTFEKYPKAKQFKDWRKMFDAVDKDIDAVIVAIPDHTHAVAAMGAIQRKKHVYCEKPLAHSVFEVRELMRAAREQNVVTQLGNQGHSFDSIRNFCEMIWDGAIGNVHTIHCGCAMMNCAIDDLPKLKEEHPVPPELDWDLWLGPAEYRPYHPAYLPGKWRRWTPFGNGTVGDWTCHVVDPVFWALDLGAPTTVQAEAPGYDPKTQGDSFPAGDIITYQFPAKGKRGAVTMKWFSGTQKIPRPEEMPADEKSIEIGAVVMGDKGTIVYGSHGASQVRLIPDAKNDAYKRPAKSLPRVPGHHQDWLTAIKDGKKAGSDFSYGGPLTEVALLGVIALKFPTQKLQWDATKTSFTNFQAANAWINPPMRKGWGWT